MFPILILPVTVLVMKENTKKKKLLVEKLVPSFILLSALREVHSLSQRDLSTEY